MYSLLLYLYQIAVFTVSFFDEKVKKMWRGEQEAFSILKEKALPDMAYIWFHAASLGEFEQARPLIEKIREERPEEKILLTFFSPSGYEVRKNYPCADIICYLPLDTPTNARRFLELINIKTAYFIKYEFWWNYLHLLKRQNIPVYSVSSIFRKEQIFFKWYGHQYKRVLKCFTHFFVQNKISKDLLETLGIRNVTISGDTRFDRVLQIKEQAKELPIVEAFLAQPRSPEASESRATVAGSSAAGSRPLVFVAGSSWPPDEDIFINYFLQHPEWKLIIAPHVIGEDHLKQIEEKLKGRKVVYYKDLEASQPRSSEAQQPRSLEGQQPRSSEASPFPAAPSQVLDADVLIINCFGLLSSIYSYADVTYVGGGFGVGIHNVLEAAVWNVPVILGPNNKRFQEAQDLLRTGGGQEIQNYESFANLMRSLTDKPHYRKQLGKAAGEYVTSKCGATKKVLNF